ncbi:MAG TPA: hypothetical protein VLI91_03765 [Roseiarcus sp.]|nr:hypothetical protein [Roseiarcus sp.]
MRVIVEPSVERSVERSKKSPETILFLLCSRYSPNSRADGERPRASSRAIAPDRTRRGKALGKRNMNAAGQIAVALAALVGFGRLFLADEGESHRLSGLLILASVVGKVALSI